MEDGLFRAAAPGKKPWGPLVLSKRNKVYDSFGYKAHILLPERFLVEMSRLDPHKQARLRPAFLMRTFPPAPGDPVTIWFPGATRGRICRKEFIWEWRRRERGREAGKAANKRSINTRVTPVNSWSRIPLGNRGAERVEGGWRRGIRAIPGRRGRAGCVTQRAGGPGWKAASRVVLSLAPPACCVRAAPQVWWPRALLQRSAASSSGTLGWCGVGTLAGHPQHLVVTSCTESIPVY